MQNIFSSIAFWREKYFLFCRLQLNDITSAPRRHQQNYLVCCEATKGQGQMQEGCGMGRKDLKDGWIQWQQCPDPCFFQEQIAFPPPPVRLQLLWCKWVAKNWDWPGRWLPRFLLDYVLRKPCSWDNPKSRRAGKGIKFHTFPPPPCGNNYAFVFAGPCAFLLPLEVGHGILSTILHSIFLFSFIILLCLIWSFVTHDWAIWLFLLFKYLYLLHIINFTCSCHYLLYSQDTQLRFVKPCFISSHWRWKWT